ncbi:MAG: ribonuclease R [Alphaproteobacteria bacterium]|nr:ribonuclease R [Alphaproteobacteria bacterium]
MKKSDILEFIQSSPTPVTKRDIASAFRLKGSGPRVAMKKILKELYNEGAIIKQGGTYTIPEGLPGVCVVAVSSIDVDGDVFVRPVDWNEELQGQPPRIELMPDKKGHPSLAVGDRALVRLKRLDKDTYEARAIKRMDAPENQIMGLLRVYKNGAILQPADKKAKFEFEIPLPDLNGAQDGDLVIGEIQPARGHSRKKARIVEILGQRDDPKAISLISLHEQGLNETFPDSVIKETEGMSVPDLKGREDMRDIPLVTIDGADARDFDDAVFAEKTDKGYHIIVAIADVSYYVRHGTALDDEAQRRGNSTYFPDRVVPMLPEALSNDLCSLRPKENRACLAVHMNIDERGELLNFKFVRGIMRSAARLIYEDVQAAYDAQKHELIDLINPLYDAFRILDKARQERGALDLDLPERQIIIDDKGNMTGVKKRLRLDAHKMIEEFMILANVAAARALEVKQAQKIPCVYRIHDRPSLEKLDSVHEFIESFGLSFPKGQVVNPKQINGLLRKAAQLPYSHLISEVILRTQAQAVYSANNIGHFGLALSKYAHFTSPIRRYADLLVHRALVSVYGLGKGALQDDEIARIDEICEHISSTERTSMVAERNAVDRFTAAFLSDHIGAEFSGRINGVTRFGLFVTLDESGADGLVPMRSLPDDYYIHDEKVHALIGRKSRRIYQLGAPVTVRLKEADGLTGSTVLELVGHEKGAQLEELKGSTKNAGKSSGKREDYRRKSGRNTGKKVKKTTPKHKRKQNRAKKHKR